jgi:hypothetical protein
VISDKLLKVFSRLYKEEFGVDISTGESKELSSRLIFLYESIFGNTSESSRAKKNDR